MRKAGINKSICIILCGILLTLPASWPFMHQAEAAVQIPLSLKQAQALAFANSRPYKKIKIKIDLAKVKYVESLKSAALKEKNMRTFRWSPLLSFKFPEWPDLVKSHEWQYKPAQIQSEITGLWHQLNDVKYEITEQVSNLYTKGYILQEKIVFTSGRIQALHKTKARNEARIATGEASQADVDKMDQALKKLESDLSLRERESASVKQKLTDIINLDVTVRYRFENSFIKADIERSVLDPLKEHSLQNDHAYYEAERNSKLGKLSLELNERLMNAHYGNQMNYIKSYVNQAKNGEAIDGEAFKAAYDTFLEAIDRPWQGKLRILFIKIPKDWFKGSLDGVRYIQDEPYALYAAAMEYTDLISEEEEVKKELLQRVTDGYEAVITAKNAYESMETALEEQKQLMEKNQVLNKLGDITYSELQGDQDAYGEMQLHALDALSAYTELLYSYDRLTCGGITKYLSGESLSTEAASGGESFLPGDGTGEPYYYIKPQIEDQLFILGISIPDDYSIRVTSFELWVNKVQIGGRTEAREKLRHLALVLDGIEHAALRLYDGDRFVDECEIDPMESCGPLRIKGQKAKTAGKKRVAATFTYKLNAGLNTVTFTFQKKPGEIISFYEIQEKSGKSLYGGKKTPIEEPLDYLLLVQKDLSRLRVLFYDEQEEPLYTGELSEATMEVIVEDE